MLLRKWDVCAEGQPLIRGEQSIAVVNDAVVVQVAGCAVCRSDLDYLQNPSTRHHLPLGHEISGTIVEAGEGAHEWLGRMVVIPAVPPVTLDGARCRCDSRSAGAAPPYFRSGLASHVITRTHGLCVVDEVELANSHIVLADLAILAEAVGTPYQAISRSQLRENDVCIFVGVTGFAAFGIQIASALGARVIALDVDDKALEQAMLLGASYVLNVDGFDPKVVSQKVLEQARHLGHCACGWKVYETSGTLHGQNLACSLLRTGGVLSVIGHSSSGGVLPLGDLASKVATAQGTCCCSAELLPEALDLILAGDIKLDSLIEHRQMSTVNETLLEMQHQRPLRRQILIPDFD